MQIELTTPAILFPAISLLLLAYSNRFLTIGQLIRQLKANVNETNYTSTSLQLDNLTLRLNMIISMQAAGVTSILICMVSMMFIFAGNNYMGKLSFVISLALMVLSLIISLLEILISSKALKIELQELKKN